MILSNVEIQLALDEGRLHIEPRPTPLRPAPGLAPCPYQTSAVDLRLGDEIVWFSDKRLSVQIDLRGGGFAALANATTERQALTESQPYSLEPGRLVLARTAERVALPLSTEPGKTLAARVEGKSSYARCGLLVHFTAPTIHAGFDGTITLEMMNFGSYPILLFQRMPICQLIVEQVAGVPFRNDSQFQGQSRPTGG